MTTDAPGEAALTAFLGRAWDRLQAAREVALATLGPGGAPEARTVVLREADRAAGRLTLHTDLLSAKVAQLRAAPRASILCWDAAAQLQMRARGAVSIASGPEAAPIWAKVPPDSRGNYGVSPPPGTPIPAPDAFTRAPDPDRFAALVLVVAQIDVVDLGCAPHRRALYSRQDGFAGTWLAP